MRYFAMSPKTGAARTARTRGGPAVAPVALIELSTALRSWGAKRPSASEVGDWRPVFSGRPTLLMVSIDLLFSGRPEANHTCSF